MGTPPQEQRLLVHGGVAGGQPALGSCPCLRGCCECAPGVCAAAWLCWLDTPCPLAITLLSLEAESPGMRRDCCLFPRVCHQPLPVREGTWLSLSVPFAVSLIPAEAGCSRGECGGGRITCCEQHFCSAPLCWGCKPAVLVNLSSYCWLRLSGASKETEEGGQRG